MWTWWRHQMETFSASLAICTGNSPVPGEFPTQRPVTRSFHVFFDLGLNKALSKQSWGWWFETLSHPLWRHCNGEMFIQNKEGYANLDLEQCSLRSAKESGQSRPFPWSNSNCTRRSWKQSSLGRSRKRNRKSWFQIVIRSPAFNWLYTLRLILKITSVDTFFNKDDNRHILTPPPQQIREKNKQNLYPDVETEHPHNLTQLFLLSCPTYPESPIKIFFQ